MWTGMKNRKPKYCKHRNIAVLEFPLFHVCSDIQVQSLSVYHQGNVHPFYKDEDIVYVFRTNVATQKCSWTHIFPTKKKKKLQCLGFPYLKAIVICKSNFLCDLLLHWATNLMKIVAFGLYGCKRNITTQNGLVLPTRVLFNEKRKYWGLGGNMNEKYIC